MPKMTNAKSADVLNSADAFEAKLRWVLFKSDQEQLLWGGPDQVPNQLVNQDRTVSRFIETTNWRPGEPMYEYPNYGNDEQYARPMFQLMEPELFNSLHQIGGLSYQCADCEVGWNDNRVSPWSVQKCWMCEKDVVLPPRPRVSHAFTTYEEFLMAAGYREPDEPLRVNEIEFVNDGIEIYTARLSNGDRFRVTGQALRDNSASGEQDMNEVILRLYIEQQEARAQEREDARRRLLEEADLRIARSMEEMRTRIEQMRLPPPNLPVISTDPRRNATRAMARLREQLVDEPPMIGVQRAMEIMREALREAPERTYPTSRPRWWRRRR